MSNPLLSEKAIAQANARAESESGWAAPTAETAAPVTDGPVTKWDAGTMTVAGAASATMMLVLLVVAAAAVTWVLIPEATDGNIIFPVGWVIGGVVVALAASMMAFFRPRSARVLAPVYAIAEGVVIGAISRAYETIYDGIVLQAVGATLAVFLVMLGLYRTRIIKVTDRMRRIVVGATLGVALFYLVSMVFGMFGAMPSFLSEATPTGIGFSLLVSGLAAFNLALDFDMIERAAEARMPAYMEWYCALGVTVTLVWLYLELLRLLAKLRDN